LLREVEWLQLVLVPDLSGRSPVRHWEAACDALFLQG